MLCMYNVEEDEEVDLLPSKIAALLPMNLPAVEGETLTVQTDIEILDTFGT